MVSNLIQPPLDISDRIPLNLADTSGIAPDSSQEKPPKIRHTPADNRVQFRVGALRI